MKLQRQRGLTLIELMIAVTLGLLLLIALASLLLQNRASYKQNDQIAGLQDQAQFALSSLSRDLMMSGFRGGIFDPSKLTVGATATAPGNDCSTTPGVVWATKLSIPMEFVNDATDSLTSKYDCIASADFVRGTDVLTLRRVAGQSAASMTSADLSVTLTAHSYYLQTNGISGTLVKPASALHTPSLSPDQPTSGAMTFYKLIPRLYFVRSYSRTAGDGLPSLCRVELEHGVAAVLKQECLAEGIEEFHIEWGVDSNNDGIADRYFAAPTEIQLNNAVTARIFLLARAREVVGQYTNSKSYQLGSKAVAAKNDRYYRRVFSTTVNLKNLRGL